MHDARKEQLVADKEVLLLQVLLVSIACRCVRSENSIVNVVFAYRGSVRWLPAGTTSLQYAVEKFHVASPNFDKQLTVELHFVLVSRSQVYGDTPVRPPTAPEEE